MTAPGAREVPVEPGLIAQVAAGIRYVFTGDKSLYDGWFGPATPPVPVAPEGTQGRQFDYPTSYNQRFIPRQGERIGFDTLRALADGYDLMRMVIETKKDQLVQTRWEVRPKDLSKNSKEDPRCDEIREFLESPDQEHTWDQWFRAGMEDMLVADAWTLLPRRKRNGKPFSLELIDGTTIKPVLSLDGRRPTEGPVYQQVLKGVIVGDFMPGELYYLPQNVRTHKVYGYSRVEQVIATVEIALNRQLHKLTYYTEGSTPDLIIEAPATFTTMGQIKEFWSWWNDLLAGNLAQRRRASVVPAGSKLTNTKEAALKDEYDDFLVRIICYCFAVSPSQLIKEQNRGKDQTQAESAKYEGTIPILDFASKQLTRVICRDLFGYSDLEIVPMEEKAIQPLVQAQIDDLDVKNGIRDINECRDGRGLQPLTPEELEERKPTPPPSPFGALAPEGKPPTGAPPKEGAEPPVPAPAAQPQKVAKAYPKTVIHRDRPEILKIEGKVAAGVSKRLHSLGKSVVPALVDAYNSLDKASGGDARARKVVDILKQEDFQALTDYLQDRDLEVYEKGVLAAADQLQQHADDAMVNLANEKGIDWALDHAGDLIKDFENATKDDISSIVGNALEEGWSNDRLANELSESWSFSATRAEVIARTETAFADVQGNVALYREAGVTQGQWIAADTDPCDECDGLDGQSVDMASGPFPPAHPNCRCDVVPVLPDEEN